MDCYMNLPAVQIVELPGGNLVTTTGGRERCIGRSALLVAPSVRFPSSLGEIGQFIAASATLKCVPKAKFKPNLRQVTSS